MASTLKKVLWDPGALRMAAKAVGLFRRAEDTEEFQQALAEGDLERAQDLVDMSEEEFHETVTEWREQAEELAEKYSDVSEADKEEILDP